MPTDAELLEMARHLASLADLQGAEAREAGRRYLAIAAGLTAAQVIQLGTVARQLEYSQRYLAQEKKS